MLEGKFTTGGWTVTPMVHTELFDRVWAFDIGDESVRSSAARVTTRSARFITAEAVANQLGLLLWVFAYSNTAFSWLGSTNSGFSFLRSASACEPSRFLVLMR